MPDDQLWAYVKSWPKSELVKYLSHAMKRAGFPSDDIRALARDKVSYLRELLVDQIRDPWPKSMPISKSERAQAKAVDSASRFTQRECRRRGIKCWTKDGNLTSDAQQIFNQAYDHYDGLR